MGGRGSYSMTGGGSSGVLQNGLNRRDVNRANGASALGNAGTMISDRLDSNIREIGSLDLTDEQRGDAIAQQLSLANDALRATAENPNPFATGRARTNRARNAAGADEISRANRAMESHMDAVREASRANRASRSRQTRAQAIQQAIADGLLSVTIDGVEYRRPSRRSKTFTRAD